MITGANYRDAVISASHNINNNRYSVDALNVYPVPDGDTGTNMSMTIAAAAAELEKLSDDVTVSEAADVAASAMLRGARGNSGVILSLIFRGLAQGLKEKEEAGTLDLVWALSCAVESAYKAVMKPTEGTILTVLRVSAQTAAVFKRANRACSVEELMEAVTSGAQEALDQTPEQLPVLKKAGVVDAGGQGLLYVLQGMFSVFKFGEIVESRQDEAVSINQQPFVKKETVASASSDIKFGYCTEFIVNRDPDCLLKPKDLRLFLQTIGDSVVCVEDEDIIKVHVHTNHPGNAMEAGLKYGSLVKMKVDNMRQQHVNAGKGDKSFLHAEKPAPVAVEPENDFGFVAVAAGDGLHALFQEIGVDTVVSGGQTMNPSTEDLLRAVESTPAKTVFLLPNNKNIIMAAELVNDLATRDVIVIPSRTIPQGISAMLQFDPDATPEDNQSAMTEALITVDTAQVTFAARASSMGKKSIQEGQMLGLENGEITVVEDDLLTAAYRVTKHLCKKHSDVSMVTILYGEGATEQDALELEAKIQHKFKGLETSVVAGGQPVYHFIIGVE